VRLLPALQGGGCGEAGGALALPGRPLATVAGVAMNAAMMFNTLVRDGNAISCDDDADAGYLALY